MEEINNTLNSNISDQFNPTLKLNIYRYLFFISLIILVGFVVYFYKNTNSTENEVTKIIPTVTPNEVTNEVSPTDIPLESFDSSQNIKNTDVYCGNLRAYSKVIGNNLSFILNKDGKEKVIDEIKDFSGGIWYDNITFSPSTRYLSFSRNAAGASTFKIYDTKNDTFIKNGKSDGNNDYFNVQTENTPYITSDEKYLLYCSGGGYAGLDGAKVINLPSQTVKFDFVKYLGDKLGSPSVICHYQNSFGLFTLEYYKDTEESERTGVNYNPVTGEVKDW